MLVVIDLASSKFGWAVPSPGANILFRSGPVLSFVIFLMFLVSLLKLWKLQEHWALCDENKQARNNTQMEKWLNYEWDLYESKLLGRESFIWIFVPLEEKQFLCWTEWKSRFRIVSNLILQTDYFCRANILFRSGPVLSFVIFLMFLVSLLKLWKLQEHWALCDENKQARNNTQMEKWLNYEWHLYESKLLGRESFIWIFVPLEEKQFLCWTEWKSRFRIVSNLILQTDYFCPSHVNSH